MSWLIYNKIKKSCGLVDVGFNEDGNIDWAGTKKQWKAVEDMEAKFDAGELDESEIDDMLAELPENKINKYDN